MTFWANSETHLCVTLGQSYNYCTNIDERVTRWVSCGEEGTESRRKVNARKKWIQLLRSRM